MDFYMFSSLFADIDGDEDVEKNNPDFTEEVLTTLFVLVIAMPL